MTTTTSQSEALWTSYKTTNDSTRNQSPDKIKELEDEIGCRLRIQKCQEVIGLIEDCIKRTEIFLSENSKGLATSTRTTISNEMDSEKRALEIMKNMMKELEEREIGE